jgi:hypothetical protein
MSPKVEELPISSIPDVVLEKAMRIIANYTVGLIRIDDDKHGKNLTLLGSGTLVTANGKHAILTAHHVVEILPTSGDVGLVYSERLTHGVISTDGLRYIKIARGAVDSEGPDLGAVILSPALASGLAALKSFHNLDRNRTMLLTDPPPLTAGLWVVQGFIAERTTEELDFEQHIKTVRFFQLSSSGTVKPYATGEYDYFELPIKYSTRASIPESYGGTSGGGLWQVRLERKASGGEITPATVPILSGVAFYQDGVECDRSALRCHGRRSAYETAYEAIIGLL